ncbi:MAG: hypothetical protein JF597_00950 [Streptomyces sp.]|uniref:hypothetical protein n=1 Tax=Streptomyces sp. TaxID=1931 RepID=UPI0025CF9637|nr:hypothetical protein [Streptomyces sp.]MBW8792206.1 hypothetical protein [Streptomyces sp.]
MPSLRPALVIGAAGALVLAGGLTTAVHGVGTTPTDVAREYLAALSAGHVSKALALTAHSATVDRTLLTTDLPPADRITKATLGRVTRKDRTATAAISYDVDGSAQTTTLRLSKHGDTWLVDNGLSSIVIDGAATDVASVAVNGTKVKVSAGSTALPAVPGLYDAKMPPTFAFTAKEQKAPVTGDPGALHFDLTATAAGEKEAAAAVLRALKACLAKAPQVLENPCGTDTTVFVDKSEFRNTGFRWTLLKAPKLHVFASAGTFEVDATAPGKAQISVYAVDLKHRYLPGRITIPTPLTLDGLVTVTFTGRVAKVTF